ncbi:hypothetical protein ACERCG_11450 [Mannheimia sp. E30BD]|uniref:hypothetical protein n=1 Tax=Mannheimia sp. E30BD TaxID=3278708 RepID=UPI00359EF474
MATRSFDTNTEKEGFERKETYHYNNLNQLVRTDRDTFDVGGDIDAYVTHERDVFGRDGEIKTYSNASGDLESHYINERDVYGNISKQTIFGIDGQITRVNNYTRDARGLEIKNEIDWNGDGIYNDLDTVIISVRDDTPQGNIISQLQSYADGRPEVYTIWGYDGFGRHNSTHSDTNKNGQIDEGERASKVSFVGESTLIDVITVYSGNELQHLQKIHYSDNNIILGSFYSDANSVYHTLSYNGYGGTRRSSTEDFTESHYDALFKQIGGAIKTLNMSNANYQTDITLDNNVLAKLTKSELVVNGDATDTIRLKDNTEFTQLDNVTRGRQEYEQYQTEVDGQQYTLLIDTDINVVLA